MMRLLTNPLIYVLAVSILPVLCGYVSVASTYPAASMVQACSICSLAAVALLSLLTLIFRNLHKAAVITLVTFIGFFSYGDLVQAVSGLIGYNLIFKQEPVAIAYAVALGAIIVLFSRLPVDWKQFALTINCISVGLVIINFTTIWNHEVRTAAKLPAIKQKFDTQGLSQGVTAPDKSNPDIYFIVMDALASPFTLKNMYGFDSARLVGFLERDGFYVATQSRSNYDRTPVSFCSFLNMNYLDDLISSVGKDSTDELATWMLAGDNLVIPRIKKAGYRVINFRSGYGVTDCLPLADENVGGGLNQFSCCFFMRTIIGAFDKHTSLLDKAAAASKLNIFRDGTLVARQPGPKFVVMHTLLCHEPYVFNADGTLRPLSRLVVAQAPNGELYGNQMRYGVKKLTTLVEQLLHQPGNKPVIIILSDHGPWVGVQPSQRETDEFFNVRMQNFMAFYFPDHDYQMLYPQISPVNAFRIVFNKYLGTNLSILPDRSYIGKEHELFDQEDVTERLKFDTGAPSDNRTSSK